MDLTTKYNLYDELVMLWNEHIIKVKVMKVYVTITGGRLGPEKSVTYELNSDSFFQRERTTVKTFHENYLYCTVDELVADLKAAFVKK